MPLSLSAFLSGRSGRLPVIGLIFLIILVVGYLVWGTVHGDRSDGYVTAPVERGELVRTISATGTLEPEEVIDVGAQVAGLITAFGTDESGKTIDFGSRVQQGTILARIDESLYQTDVQQAQAQLQRSQADLEQLKAKLFQAEQDWKRAQALGQSDALSASAFTSYQAGFLGAKANVSVGEAAVQQAQSALSRAQRNLGYCTIRSPVSGVIIDKRVNVGQTVVSSLNAPSLFLLAKDLTRMQVWVSVNEADIGNVKVDQRVRFTADAFPGESFEGKVQKIRLNATMAQNVVTYLVEVATDNSSGRLLPYLTVDARFEVAHRAGVLTVPNSALRWNPPASDQSVGESPIDTRDKGAIWILDEGAPKRVAVSVGVSDGSRTEVSSDLLLEGMPVITALNMPTQSGDQATGASPFAPKMPRGGRTR